MSNVRSRIADCPSPYLYRRVTVPRAAGRGALARGLPGLLGLVLWSAGPVPHASAAPASARPLLNHCSAALLSAAHTPPTDRAELRYYVTGLDLRVREALRRTLDRDRPNARAADLERALVPNVDDVYAYASTGERSGATMLAASAGRLRRLRSDLDEDAPGTLIVAHVLRGHAAIDAYLNNVWRDADRLDDSVVIRLRPNEPFGGRYAGRAALGIASVVGGVFAWSGLQSPYVSWPMVGATFWVGSTLLNEPVGRCWDAVLGVSGEFDGRRVQLDSFRRVVRGALDEASATKVPIVHAGFGVSIPFEFERALQNARSVDDLCVTARDRALAQIDNSVQPLAKRSRLLVDHAVLPDFDDGNGGGGGGPVLIAVARLLTADRLPPPREPRPRIFAPGADRSSTLSDPAGAFAH